MRIWIINHYADPPDGMATRTYDIAKRWTEAGHEVTVFVSNFSHYRFARMRSLSGLRLWQDEVLGGVRLTWLRTSGYRRNDWRRAANMAAFAVLATVAGVVKRPRPDLVIGVSVHPLAAAAGWLVSRLRRSRFALEITDLWPQSLVDLGRLQPDAWQTRVMRRLERFLCQQAELIVMLWRHTDSYVASLGVSTDKIVWVPHGVELRRYEGIPPYDGGLKRPFRIMYLGGFVESMALDNLLAAARLVMERGKADVQFLLVGAGTHREEVMATAHDLGLNNVEFPEAVPKDRIAERMSDADAFIFGTHDVDLYKYGQSLNKLMDYLAGGRPIIYYGRSSYNPVELARAGLTCEPDRPEALAGAVEQLVALAPAERIAMGARGREYLVAQHTIPVLADRLLVALQSGRDRRGIVAPAEHPQ